MPIRKIDTTTAPGSPGSMVQVCAFCGAEHTISFDRGAQKTKTGPFALTVGDTLLVRVDAVAAPPVVFAQGDFATFSGIAAAELAARLETALPGIRACDDAGGVLIESKTTGPGSSVEVTGGTARAALGFATNGRADPCVTRPVLGVSFGKDQHHDRNVLALRRCNDCGANECLIRTLDCAAPELAGTHFHAHRMVVNALAEHCKACGWSHPELAELHAAETVRPQDLHAALTQGAVVLPPPPPPDKTLAAARSAPRGAP